MVESNTSGNHRTPEEIQREMECTRQQIDKSVNSLEAKLTPEHLIAGAERWLTGGRVSQSGPLKDHVAAFVRGYPLPSALVGVAAAWVVVDRFLAGTRPAVPGQGGLTHGHSMGGDTIRNVGRSVGHGVQAVGDATMTAAGAVKHGAQAVGSGLGTAASATGHAASVVGHGVYDAASAVGHVAGSAAHTVGHTVAGTAQRVGDFAGSAAHTIGHTASQVGQTVGHTAACAARGTKKTMVKTYDEYPIGMGLVAAGLGLAAGMLIPHTRAEDKMMGHVADKAKDQAGRIGSQVKQELKEQTKEIKDAGKSVIREIKAEIKPGVTSEREESQSGMGAY